MNRTELCITLLCIVSVGCAIFCNLPIEPIEPVIEMDIVKIQQACNDRGEPVKIDGLLTPNGDGETEMAMNRLAGK